MAVNDNPPQTAAASPQRDVAFLLSTLRKRFPTLAAQYRIKSLGLFGSYVRNRLLRK